MKQTKSASKLLRQARLEKKMTQSRLAEAINVGTQTVGSWERGIRTPSLDVQSRLCAVLGKTPEQLGLQLEEEQSFHDAVQKEEEAPEKPSSLVVSVITETDLHSGFQTRKRSIEDHRQRMLQRVRSRWVTGILEHSLYKAILLVLGLQEQPDVVENPWRLAVQESNLPPRYLPESTRIIDIYDDTGGELLLLGEPGAGKTTLLLDLARTLLNRAEQNEHHPMPVIFNLSSWAQRRLPLAAWLVEELHSKYQIPFALGHTWIATDQILLLLDGLDEVDPTCRSACVEAMNRYREEHGLVPLVVCSRSSDYLSQPVRLLVRTAVIIQPLSLQQIQDYIAATGGSLTALQCALDHDPILQEMASTPLMLNILVLTYHQMSHEELQAGGSLVQRRHNVLKHYVERVLQRRGPQKAYTPEQTIRYLAWLAHQMCRHSQTEFYLERMQPDWLPSPYQYRRILLRLIYGIESMIIAALYAWLRGGKQGNEVGVSVGLLGALGSQPGNALLDWMAPGIGGGLEGGGSLGVILMLVFVLVTLLMSNFPLPTLSWKMLVHGLSRGLHRGCIIGGSVGIFAGLLFSLNGGLVNGLYRGLGAGFFCLLLTGLTVGLIAGLNHEQTDRQDYVDSQFSPDVKQQRRSTSYLSNILLFGGCAGLGFGGVYSWLAGALNTYVMTYGSIAGAFLGILFGIGGGTDLIRGLGTDIQPAEMVAWSWSNIGQNLKEHVKKAVMIGLCVTGCVTVVIGCASAFFYSLEYGLRYGLVYGLIIGLVGGVAGVLTGVLTSGWSSMLLNERQLVQPNEGIRRSIKHALFAACLFGPIGGLASGIVSGLAFGLVGGVPGWPILLIGFTIIFSLIFALQFGAIHGGAAVIAHYVLRWYLWRAGKMPWDVIRFLDYAAERILLRKIGGGYIFAHRLLMDYFANLYQSKTSPEKAQ